MKEYILLTGASSGIGYEMATQLAAKKLNLISGKKIVGFNNWFVSNLPRFTPDRIMMKIKKKLASQQK